MIISELNTLETVEAVSVVGGIVDRSYNQTDFIGITFASLNAFQTVITSPGNPANNSAAAGAKADAQNNRSLAGVPFFVTSYTKADTMAVTETLGSSFSASTSVAVIALAL
ncbi:hypothetical protein [Anabaenopsis elenkinii]|uniref:Uncharacterized protein n=1 Tax=Anabaenopsis elenkinii CCIBt3563 TaxID=2779889 RepID=A0A7S6RF97_9CYAN|nr:hypothetical protein [Anabaenopsis elenkinii]QOV23720.1 hypothetical protein IM676_05370 [Anabaenopsis elenkinii CCIBt3563]